MNEKNRLNLGIGLAIGISIGAALGVAFRNVAVGIGAGIAIGAAIGLTLNPAGWDTSLTPAVRRTLWIVLALGVFAMLGVVGYMLIR